MIMSTISPWLVNENSSVGALLFFRKLSCWTYVSPICFATLLPAFAKKVLNSFAIALGFSIDVPATVNF